MPLSKPRTIFGIHEVVFYSRITGLPFGTLRVLAGSTLTLAGELVTLTGGSAKYPWDVQDGAITAEISLKPKELPNFLFTTLLGKTPTEVLDDAGNVETLTNIQGTTVSSATGITAVGIIGTGDDVKFGKYIIKAVSATTVDIFATTNVDFNRGTDKEYIDDALKINPTPLSITSTPVAIPDFGIELTGPITPVMVIGDTASFVANPPSTIETKVKIGATADCIPEFGAILTAQKQSDNTIWNIDCFRVKATGFPFGMEEKAFNEAEITAMLIYDSLKDGLFDLTHIVPTGDDC